MTYVQPNCHLAVHTQTQKQTETEGYRMHTQVRCIQMYPKLTYGREKLHNCAEYFGMPVWDML